LVHLLTYQVRRYHLMEGVDTKYVIKTIMIGILVIAALIIIYVYYRINYDRNEVIPIPVGRPKPIKQISPQENS
jgi:hypothetical protein